MPTSAPLRAPKANSIKLLCLEAQEYQNEQIDTLKDELFICGQDQALDGPPNVPLVAQQRELIVVRLAIRKSLSDPLKRTIEATKEPQGIVKALRSYYEVSNDALADRLYAQFTTYSLGDNSTMLDARDALEALRIAFYSANPNKTISDTILKRQLIAYLLLYYDAIVEALRVGGGVK